MKWQPIETAPMDGTRVRQPTGNPTRSLPMTLEDHNAPSPDDCPPDLKSKVDALTDDQRLDLFSHYCQSCGRKDPRCQCWNDE